MLARIFHCPGAISKHGSSYRIIVCCIARISSYSGALFAYKGSIDSKCFRSEVSIVPGSVKPHMDCLNTNQSNVILYCLYDGCFIKHCSQTFTMELYTKLPRYEYLCIMFFVFPLLLTYFTLLIRHLRPICGTFCQFSTLCCL